VPATRGQHDGHPPIGDVGLCGPNQAPIVNAVAAALVVLFVIPVYLAQRLSEGGGGGRI
jgi:hypothetical protein